MRQYLVKENEAGADADEAVGEIEHGKGPSLGIEEHVVDHVTIDEAVDDIAERTGDDHGKAEMGDVVIWRRPSGAIELKVLDIGPIDPPA